MTKKTKKVRIDYELAEMGRQLKAIRALVKEWDNKLPTHFYLIINNILNRNN
jgi:DNA-binding HxlR family transcriptional regulator